MRLGLLTGAVATAPGPELPKAPSGIAGLDEITRGGLPRDRVTLLAGGPGSGKTLMGLTFLVAGARQYGEPGVLLSFEESAAKVAAHVRSLGFNLDELQREGLLSVLSFQLDPEALMAAGDFSLDPLFQSLEEAIGRVGAKRVVLDTVELLFGTFRSDTVARAEFARLVQRLEVQGVTAVVTVERSGAVLPKPVLEEYVSDCVIMLDHQVRGEVSTRYLRVVKYRGSAHGTNAYPFLISESGITMLPITSVGLDYGAPTERVSTGIDQLDGMLGGGLFRGSATLVTGASGTGKTTLGACMLNAACERGERALWVLYDESPEQALRNMRSAGFDLRPWMDAGLLRLWAARPTAFGMESHLAILARLLHEVTPQVVVVDGINSFALQGTKAEVAALVTRKFDLLKSLGITTLAIALSHGGETSVVNVSSVVDTWLLFRSIESAGTRLRVLSVLKMRGSAHSYEAREFIITNHGIEVGDVYAGPRDAQAGTTRPAKRSGTARAAGKRRRR